MTSPSFTYKLTPKFNRKIWALKKTPERVITKLGKQAQEIAKSIAPKYRPYTYSLIKLYITKDGQGSSFRLVSQNSTTKHTDGKITNFNLPRWMHETKGIFQTDNPAGKAGTQHIKSGSPTYMYDTKDLLKRMSRKVTRDEFRKTISLL